MTFIPVRDQREAPRRALKSFRFVVPSVGEVLNVSTHGLCVQANSGLPVGVTSSFKLERPGRVATIAGCIRWCRLVRTVRIAGLGVAPVYVSGIEVIAPDARVALADFVS